MTMGLCFGGFFFEESCCDPVLEGGCPRDVSETLDALELSVKDRWGSVGRVRFDDLDRNRFHFLGFCGTACRSSAGSGKSAAALRVLWVAGIWFSKTAA